jgi:hypothetical protein
MVAKRYRVMVFTGTTRPNLVRSIGWFGSSAEADAYREREGLGVIPAEGEWGVVAPPDEEIPMQSPEGGDA